jgi:predicted MPP superfamily phosphohydrolase
MVRLLGFLAVAGAIFVLIHGYLWWRLVRGTTSRRRWRWTGAVAVAVLALLVPVSFFGEQAVHWLAWPGYLWLALMFYLLVILAVVELPMLVARRFTGDKRGPDMPDEQRRLLLARGAAIFAGLTAAGVTGYGVATAIGPPEVKRVRIPLARLDRRMDGYRIALVSDIHIGPMRGRAHTERIVAMVNRLDADLIAVVGDLVDGSVAEFGGAAAPLRDLRARQGSYFVTGNHEYYSGYQQWMDEVARLSVRPLRNERVELAGIDLAGVNDLTGEDYDDGPDLGRALGGRDTARPVILLAHQPVQVHEAARHGVDLQLSGHTHGGQMFPFHLLVRLQQPVVSGLATVDGTRLYVTNGVGFWGPPVRVGAPPAIALVELRAT